MAKHTDPEDKGLENEGEGSRTAARHYDDATQKFVADGKVDAAAKKAAEALDGAEAKDLAEAEAEGKRHAAVPPGSDQHEKESPRENKGASSR